MSQCKFFQSIEIIFTIQFYAVCLLYADVIHYAYITFFDFVDNIIPNFKDKINCKTEESIKDI